MSENNAENKITVDSVETLEKKIAQVREAQKIFSTYTQEQVDKIVAAMALAGSENSLS